MSAFSKEIRSFLVVSQSGSIRAAAERLNISAPALSRQIQILERSYGAALLVRSSEGVALTASGEALRNEALAWMEAETRLQSRLRRTEEPQELRLRMGIMEGLVPALALPLQDRLSQTFGRVEVELTVGTTRDIIDRAEALELDLIVAFNLPLLSRLVVVERFEYHLGVVHAPGAGPAGEGPVPMGDALRHPLCLPSAALSMHTRLLAEILSVRVNPQVSFASNSISALLRALKAGRGVGFLTWVDVCTEVEAGELVFRPLAASRLTETLSVTICRGNSLGQQTGAVVEEIQKILRGLGC